MMVARHIDFPDDCLRIQRICFYRFGLQINQEEAQELWERFSDTVCASWLLLPKDDDILKANIQEVLTHEEATDAQGKTDEEAGLLSGHSHGRKSTTEG